MYQSILAHRFELIAKQLTSYCKQVTFQESSLTHFSYFPNSPTWKELTFFSPIQFIFFSLLSPHFSPEPSIFFLISHHCVSVLSSHLLLLNNPNCATWHTDFGQPHNPWKCDMYRNMCHNAHYELCPQQNS